MRFAITAAALVGAASASYGYGEYPVNSTAPAYTATPTPSDVYTTKVVTELTTYCPSATEITQGGKTYTVTSETTLTITDCPCTVVETPSYTPAPPAETSAVPPVYSSAPAPSSAPSAPAPAPYPSTNGTTVVPVYPTGTAPPTTSSSTPAEFPGAASQAGVGLLAVVGALAAFL